MSDKIDIDDLVRRADDHEDWRVNANFPAEEPDELCALFTVVVRQLQAENDELRAKLDNAEWCADVVSEANQQRGITDKVREYLDSGGDPWGDDEQNLFWAAQDADLREETLRAENAELQRKNASLKADIDRQASAIVELRAQVERLKRQHVLIQADTQTTEVGSK